MTEANDYFTPRTSESFVNSKRLLNCMLGSSMASAAPTDCAASLAPRSIPRPELSTTPTDFILITTFFTAPAEVISSRISFANFIASAPPVRSPSRSTLSIPPSFVIFEFMIVLNRCRYFFGFCSSCRYRRFFIAVQPVIRNRRCNENRGVRSGDNSDKHCECKSAKHFAAPDKKYDKCKEHCAGGYDRPGQCFINCTIDDRFQILP